MTPLWDDLLAANERTRRHDDASSGDVPVHEPKVAVLTCADARVSPARLFDLPPGSLFVVRVAGASATAEAVASLSYAVQELNVGTVVVLGHTHCGAVSAAVEGVEDPSLEPLLAPIRSALKDGCDRLECAVTAHVASTVTALHRDPGPLGVALRSGRVAAHAALVDIVDGSLTRLPH